MSSTKVAHVIYSFGTGGLEKGITTLINHGSDDIAHIIISLCGTKDSEKLLKKPAQIICLDKKGGNSPRFIWDLAKVIRAVRPNVVHTLNWSSMDGILAARLDAIKNHGALIDAVNQVAAAGPCHYPRAAQPGYGAVDHHDAEFVAGEFWRVTVMTTA